MEENQLVFELEVDNEAASNLRDFTKWARFLAIVGFIAMGLITIVFIAAGRNITSELSDLIPGLSSQLSMGMIAGILVVVVAVGSVLMYLLLKGSNLIREGIRLNNQETFNSGLGMIKNYFMIYGILAIIGFLANLFGLFI